MQLFKVMARNSLHIINGVSICPANRTNSLGTICPANAVRMSNMWHHQHQQQGLAGNPITRWGVMAESGGINLNVGDKFSTFSQLEVKIRQYELQKKVEFYKRDSRTIESARKGGIKRDIREELKFYQIRYSCINGGKMWQNCTRSNMYNKK